VAAVNPEADSHTDPRRIRTLSVWVIAALMVAFALLGGTLRSVVYDSTALSTAGTVFAGIFVQALPFLALGVVLSALLAVFVTPDRLSRPHRRSTRSWWSPPWWPSPASHKWSVPGSARPC